MNEDQAFKIMREIQNLWPRPELSEETINSWAHLLKDLPLEAVMLAINELACTEKFMPSIAEIRTAAVTAIPGNEIPTADQAWAEVVDQARRIGSNRGRMNLQTQEIIDIEFSHPAILELVDSLGWDQIINSDQPGIYQNQFMKIYPVVAERFRKEQLTTPLGKHLSAKLAEVGPVDSEQVSSEVSRIPSVPR